MTRVASSSPTTCIVRRTESRRRHTDPHFWQAILTAPCWQAIVACDVARASCRCTLCCQAILACLVPRASCSRRNRTHAGPRADAHEYARRTSKHRPHCRQEIKKVRRARASRTNGSQLDGVGGFNPFHRPTHFGTLHTAGGWHNPPNWGYGFRRQTDDRRLRRTLPRKLP